MTQPQWTAEFEITASQAVELIAAQFPQLAPVSCEPFGVGWDNVAFLVNGEFVFRLPRRALGAQLIDAELALMPAIAPLLSLPVTVASFVGKPSAQFKWPFGGYRMIRGTTACRAKLTDQQRSNLATTLAGFLKSLHAVDPEFARRHGAQPDRLRRFDMPYRKSQARERLQYAVDHRLLRQGDLLLAIVDETPDALQPRDDTLVHGDLYSRHLIVDDAANLAGVIDWGDVHLGDSIVDIAIAFTFLPAPARQVFLRHYGQINDQTWLMARFHALRHTACVLPYAHETGDKDLLRECLYALANLAPSRND